MFHYLLIVGLAMYIKAPSVFYILTAAFFCMDFMSKYMSERR